MNCDAADGFVTPTDPHVALHPEGHGHRTVSDGLVHRYNLSASPDELRGYEGHLLACTFFYVDALARAGRLTEAELTLQKMHTYACYR
jgi:GH15 family glucan-1,4-alpha-glucosidase